MFRLRRGLLAALALVLAVVLVPGCGTAVDAGGDGSPPLSSSPQGEAARGTACPPAAARSGRVMIDYVDFFQVADRQYLRTGATVAASAVDRQVGTVRCRLDGSGAGPDYRPVSGDAAFLPAGTPVLSVRGRSPLATVAVPDSGHFAVYATNARPAAETGVVLPSGAPSSTASLTRAARRGRRGG